MLSRDDVSGDMHRGATSRELGIDLLQGSYLTHPQEQLRTGDEEVAQMAQRSLSPLGGERVARTAG